MPNGSAVLDLETGVVDHRFDHLGEFGQPTLSPDGRFIAFATSTGLVICDTHNGKELWRIPNQDFPGNRGPMGFDETGNTFAVSYRLSPSEFRTEYRSSSDGRKVSPPPGRRLVPKHLIGGQFTLATKAAQKLNPWLARLRLPELNIRETACRVVDVETSRTVGTIERDDTFSFQLAPDGSGLAEQVSGTRINYFRLPPPMNWGWLLWWALIPPVVVWGIGWGRRWWRFRREGSDSLTGHVDSPVADASGSRSVMPQG
jgi:hypothetical protein